MKTYAIGPRIPIEAYLGREEESPTVLTTHKDIVVVGELGISSSQLHTDVWLKIGLYETVTRKHTKR